MPRVNECSPLSLPLIQPGRRPVKVVFVMYLTFLILRHSPVNDLDCNLKLKSYMCC